MPPPNAEWMTLRIRIHLVPSHCRYVIGDSQDTSTESYRLCMRLSEIFDVEVQVNLLGTPIRPVRRLMIRSQLHADYPLVLRVEDTMKTAIAQDNTSEHPSPKGTLCFDITCIKDNNSPNDFHRFIVSHPSDIG